MADHAEDIGAYFIKLLGGVVVELLGAKELSTLVPEMTARTGISRFWKGAVESRLDPSDRITLEARAHALIRRLEHAFGHEITENWLEDVYTKLERAYDPALANERVLPLITEGYLEKYRLQLLSREELEDQLEHERERDRELAAANAQLREMDRRKSEFISVAAHQLRTPLAGLKWALDLLVKREAGPVTEEQKDILEKSYAENEHMIALVEEMLQADRIEAGRFALSPQLADLTSIVKEVIEGLSPSATQKNITITFNESPETLPPIMLDPEKIHEVFQNLIQNAIIYSPANSTITVTLKKGTQTVSVNIADHGIGIPKGIESEIFSRFYRAENARRVEPNGNGLGLYIAKNILTLHAGSISFESTEGVGTTFVVTLPL